MLITTTSEPAPCQQTVHFISEYLSKPLIFPVPALKMNFLVFSAAFTMIMTIHGGELLITEGFCKHIRKSRRSSNMHLWCSLVTKYRHLGYKSQISKPLEFYKLTNSHLQEHSPLKVSVTTFSFLIRAMHP